MDAIFTIPYGEYSVADELSKEKLSVFIPSSRQEKGIENCTTSLIRIQAA